MQAHFVSENGFPKQRLNRLAEVVRKPEHLEKHYEIKDPVVVQVREDYYVMYASVGNSVTQLDWLVGRFEAPTPLGPWKELEPVEFVGVSGPQLCAPAVTYENGKFVMYVQTGCFVPDTVIARATSSDGKTFVADKYPVVTKDSTKSPEVIGVYDVGVSFVRQGDKTIEALVYSGYRNRIGCGDVYLTTREVGGTWSDSALILKQEDVPFHNRPDYEFFEWGLEGAKVIQLGEKAFLLVGVCFMPLPNGNIGRRQRVFMAAAERIHGPYMAITTPFEPTELNGMRGENGHPDTVILGDHLFVIYQERHGDNQPWHLRNAQFSLPELQVFTEDFLATAAPHLATQPTALAL